MSTLSNLLNNKLVLHGRDSKYGSSHSSPEAITASRKRLGLSQRELAEGLGISVSTVQSWEQGRRNPSGIAARFMEMVFENEDKATK